MNINALVNNLKTARQICKSPVDVLNYMKLIYSHSRFATGFRKKNYTINFSFDNYLGDLTLTLRNNAGSDAFIFSEVFGQKCYEIELPFTPNTILDLGGNIGLSSIFFSQKYPNSSIATVEPMENNLKVLHENVSQNNANINILPVAVATEDGEVNICITDLDYDHHILTNDQNIDEENTASVKAQSIKTVMHELGWGRINLLKMDIEGYEKVLLKEKANWLEYVDALCIEIHDDYTEKDLLELAPIYEFSNPVELPGGLWLLVKKDAAQRLREQK